MKALGITRLVGVNLARSLELSDVLGRGSLIISVEAGVQSALKDAPPVTKFC